ncbi:semaphorin-1A [Halyomorpha halys]|uniref:semaphorin-1A n=1 Tax=Halyomorpha halys TaxID=286706 RepID=UPI0006D4E79B|nr:semaphorin-1A-like [Halyomorpha halys]XP_024216511.1 semaphorin-1A-like [Halyomorpha halys]
MYHQIYSIIFFLSWANAWIQNPDPRMHTTYKEEHVERFLGNDSFVDYFKLLYKDQHSFLVGSRDVVYNISLKNLVENRAHRIYWPPSGAHKELCYLKGKSEEDCHNYIRVGAKIDEDQIFICGTNSYKPLCRTFKYGEDKEYKNIKETEGLGWCPYDPNHNSTAVYTDGQFYVATVADFGGVDPLIYREPLRTERSDLKQLNDPNFVSSMDYGSYVLFFFREPAVEYINCGKVIYSRVARVCKQDKGGPHQFGDRWTSFLKARLNCSMPGDYPFYFNEIQSTSDIVEGIYDSNPTKVIYGAFTTPANSIGGSAICAFSIDDIMRTFDGPFKEQSNMNSNWLPVPPTKVPQPRPGVCVNDSRTLPDVSVNFVKAHPLMDEAVPSFSQPLLIRVSLRNRFTAIAVDPQVKTLNGQAMDVLFIGTDDGRIIKAVNRGMGKPGAALFTEEIQITNSNSAIKSLTVVRHENDVPKLLIITNEVIHSVPLYRCSTITTCRECVGIQDPYCAWDPQTESCIAHNQFNGNTKQFLQNIIRGSHPSCQPPGQLKSAVAVHPLEGEEEMNDVMDKDGSLCPKCTICNPNLCSANEVGGGTQEKIVIYTADTLGLVVTTAVLATLVVGFVAGYLCSRHFRPDNAYTNMPLHHQHNSPLNGEGASYLSPCANNKSINLLVNVPPKNANDKNANTSSENNKTLQKVKKTYI